MSKMASREENITLTELLYAIVMRYGKDRTITVRAAHELVLPKQAAILVNTVGNDLIISVMVDEEVDGYLDTLEDSEGEPDAG